MVNIKFSTKDKIFFSNNQYSYIECIIIGYIICNGDITYRIMDPIKKECFDAKEFQLMSLEDIARTTFSC